MKGGIVGIVILVCLWLWILSDISVGSVGSWANKVTIYQEYCTDFKHSVFDCPTRYNVQEQEFRVFPEQQIVVQNLHGVLVKYEDCTVYDAENWKCPLGGHNHKLVEDILITHGQYYNADDERVSEGINGPGTPAFINGQSIMSLYFQIGQTDWNVRNLMKWYSKTFHSTAYWAEYDEEIRNRSKM